MKTLFLCFLCVFAFLVADAQQTLTLGNALYFTQSGNAGDGLPYARFSENWGVRFGTASSQWVLSTANSFLAGYQPAGQDWGIGNIYSSGKIAIGTISPQTKFHLEDVVPVSAQSLNALTKLTIDAANGGFAEFRNSMDNYTYTGLLFTDNNLGGYVAFRNAPDDKLHLGAYGGISFEVGSNNSIGGKTEQMKIDASGNIGIGTSTPSTKFDVNGYTRFTNPTGRTLIIERDNEDSWLTFHDPGDSWFSMGLDISNNKNFAINYGGTVGANNHFVMTPTGDVGIGTTSPNQKLTVNGTIYGKEVKVDLNVPGPDYVFEKDYKLPSLDEIRSYVDQHKHLPEVPSAKEMEQNGINLSEMNMILLRKIEELTLHVIEQNKLITKLQEERAASPDLSGKKVEELTLFAIEANKKLKMQELRLDEQEHEIKKLKKK